MSQRLDHRPHQPNDDAPDEFEPGALPVEPDEGPVPASIPDDPEHERSVDPGANPPWPALRMTRPIEAARCQ